MAVPMSDEEYGRAWCRLVGKSPGYDSTLRVYTWFPTDDDASAVPDCVYALLPMGRGMDCFGYYRTEHEAYAAVGKAVREIHAVVPVVPA